MRRVVFNQKGGVGKSTIVCNLAAISASRGVDTLVLDLDPQGNASRYLSSSVKIRESHSLSRPMIHLDAAHKLSLELEALFDALTNTSDGMNSGLEDGNDWI